MGAIKNLAASVFGNAKEFLEKIKVSLTDLQTRIDVLTKRLAFVPCAVTCSDVLLT